MVVSRSWPSPPHPSSMGRPSRPRPWTSFHLSRAKVAVASASTWPSLIASHRLARPSRSAIASADQLCISSARTLEVEVVPFVVAPECGTEHAHQPEVPVGGGRQHVGVVLVERVEGAGLDGVRGCRRAR